jgi:gas vesicle protein
MKFESNQVVGFLGGAVLGALVGGVAALLLTPSSGMELRQQMRDRAQYVQDEVKRAADERRAELEKQLTELRAPRPAGPVSN